MGSGIATYYSHQIGQNGGRRYFLGIEVWEWSLYLTDMARRPRVHFPGASYHVIARSVRLQKIFFDDGDYELYLSFLREYKERDWLKIPGSIHGAVTDIMWQR